MKKTLTLLVGLGFTVSGYAGTPHIVATLKIENQTDHIMARWFAGLACGLTENGLSAQQRPPKVVTCTISGVDYYSFYWPQIYIAPNGSASGALEVLSDGGFGKIEVDYIVPYSQEFGCELLVNFRGDKVTHITVKQENPSQPYTCAYTRDDKKITLTIK